MLRFDAIAEESKPNYLLVTFDYTPPVTPWNVAGDNYVALDYAATIPKSLKRLEKSVAKDYQMQWLEGWVIQSIDLYCVLYEVAAGSDIEAYIQRLANDDRVAAVEVLEHYSLMNYSDPLYDVQFPSERFAVHRLHRLGKGKGQRVAIVDSGVDSSHPDLQSRIAQEFVLLPENHRQNLQHGTAVAGVIAAKADNGEGIVGMAPEAEIYSYQACGEANGKHQCSSFSLLKALAQILEDDIDVLNLSLAGKKTPLMEALVNELVAQDVLIIAASNGQSHSANFPASHPKVIAVSESDQAYHWYAQSPRLSTRAGGGYQHYFGSSMGAAGVTGLVAVLREQHNANETFVLIDEIQQNDVVLDKLLKSKE